MRLGSIFAKILLKILESPRYFYDFELTAIQKPTKDQVWLIDKQFKRKKKIINGETRYLTTFKVTNITNNYPSKMY